MTRITFETVASDIWISVAILELVSRWHLFAFTTKWFAEDHWKSSLRFFNTVSMFEEWVQGLLSSAYPAKTILRGASKNITDIDIDKSGPEIDCWGTPEFAVIQWNLSKAGMV